MVWEERGRELGKRGVSMREGHHLGSEVECGVKGMVRCWLRKGAPHLGGAHTKFQVKRLRFGVRGDVFPPRAWVKEVRV
jgi:hypothetical protein